MTLKEMRPGIYVHTGTNMVIYNIIELSPITYEDDAVKVIPYRHGLYKSKNSNKIHTGSWIEEILEGIEYSPNSKELLKDIL